MTINIDFMHQNCVPHTQQLNNLLNHLLATAGKTSAKGSHEN
jgi:hypothetical protein